MKRAIAFLAVILLVAILLWNLFSTPLREFKSPFNNIGGSPPANNQK